MVLKQKDEISSNLNSKLTKLGYKRLDVDLESILNDEKLIQSMIKGAQASRKKELAEIHKVLSGIQTNCRNGSIPILWFCADGLARSYPCELANFENDGVDCTNYIKRPDNSTVVRVTYDDLDDIIAFEMMNKDLGFTHRKMEELLKDVGIMTQTSADVLLNIIGDNEPYKYSKMYKIGRQAYWNEDDSVMYDYFQTMTFNTKYYKIPVEYSCRHAIQFILDRLLDQLRQESVVFSLCSLDDRSITFLIDLNSKPAFEKVVLEPVTIRAFGRMFNTQAKIEEVEGLEDLS